MTSSYRYYLDIWCCLINFEIRYALPVRVIDVRLLKRALYVDRYL
jgi:hypothetical protein